MSKSKTVRTKKVESEEEVKTPGEVAAPATDDVGEEEVAAPKGEHDSFDVIKNDNQFVRQYSEEQHGEEFKSLAEEFVGKKSRLGGAYKLVPSSEIGLVEVRYREKEDAEKPNKEQKSDSVFVDKAKQFTDKTAASEFAKTKFGSTIVVIKVKAKK